MANSVTKQDLNQAVSDITNVIRDFAIHVDKRFDEVNKRFDTVDEKYNNVMTTMDRLAKNLAEFSAEMRARDAEVARIKRWVEQIAKETGVKLEY